MQKLLLALTLIVVAVNAVSDKVASRLAEGRLSLRFFNEIQEILRISDDQEEDTAAIFQNLSLVGPGEWPQYREPEAEAWFCLYCQLVTPSQIDEIFTGPSYHVDLRLTYLVSSGCFAKMPAIATLSPTNIMHLKREINSTLIYEAPRRDEATDWSKLPVAFLEQIAQQHETRFSWETLSDIQSIAQLLKSERFASSCWSVINNYIIEQLLDDKSLVNLYQKMMLMAARSIQNEPDRLLWLIRYETFINLYTYRGQYKPNKTTDSEFYMLAFEAKVAIRDETKNANIRELIMQPSPVLFEAFSQDEDFTTGKFRLYDPNLLQTDSYLCPWLLPSELFPTSESEINLFYAELDDLGIVRNAAAAAA